MTSCEEFVGAACNDRSSWGSGMKPADVQYC